MAILQVRNLPDPVYTRLKEQAAENRRSVTQEAILLLEDALGFDTSGRNLRNRMIGAILETGLSEKLWGGDSGKSSKVTGSAGPPDPAAVIERLRVKRETPE